MRERVEAMKAMWTEDEASYHGKYVDFDPIWLYPKPVQQPHPPVLIGGNGATVLDRVLAYGDGWFPNRIGDEEHNIPRIEELQRRAAEAGRDPVPVTLQIPPKDPDSLRRYEQAGRHPQRLHAARDRRRRARRHRAQARRVGRAGSPPTRPEPFPEAYSQISMSPPEIAAILPPRMSNSSSSSALSRTTQSPALAVGWPIGYGSSELPQFCCRSANSSPTVSPSVVCRLGLVLR